MNTRLTLLAAALFAAPLLVAPARAADAKTYTVNLSPPSKVGEKVTLVSTATRSQQMTVNLLAPGQPAAPMQQQRQKMVVRLEADAEAIAVFPNGGVQKAALVIRRLTLAQDDQPEKSILPAGSKVTAERINLKDQNFTMDGKPVSPEIAEVLKMGYSGDDAKHTNQELFGPGSPVAVGAAWPVKGELMAEQFKDDMGGAVQAAGSLKLDGIKGEGAAQVAAVSGVVTMQNIQMPGMPPGFVTKVAEAKLEINSSTPASHKAGNVDAATLGMAMTFAGEAPGPADGTKISLAMEMSEQHRIEATFR